MGFGRLQVHSSILRSKRSEGKAQRDASDEAVKRQTVKTPSSTVTHQWCNSLASLEGSSNRVFLLSTSTIVVHVLCHHFIILLSVCSYADVSLSCFWFRLELIVHSATFAVHAVPWKRRGCRCQVLTCHCFKSSVSFFFPSPLFCPWGMRSTSTRPPCQHWEVIKTQIMKLRLRRW